MSLIKCDECKNEYSSTVKSCPHCGYKVKGRIGLGGGLLIFMGVILIIGLFNPDNKNNSIQEDNSNKIAAFIETQINYAGFNGCKCNIISRGHINCDVKFPAGTNSIDVEYTIKDIAEKFVQAAPFPATVHYIGYSGYQKICEYTYDENSKTVIKEKLH